MPLPSNLSRAEKQRRAEQEKKRAKIRECFKFAYDYYYTKWEIYDDQGCLHPNSSGLFTVINQPRFHNIRHIIILGLGDPGPIQHGNWVEYPEDWDDPAQVVPWRKQERFFKRLAVVRRLRKILVVGFPQLGTVEAEDDDRAKFSEGAILGLNHLQITVVNGKHQGFRRATEHSLIYYVRHLQGDIIRHIGSNLQLPAAVLTDVPSLRPQSRNGQAQVNISSKVKEKYNFISLVGTCHHTTQSRAKELTDTKTPFMLAQSPAEMAEKESQLTEKAYATAPTTSMRATTYASEPQIILLCRKDLPFFDKHHRAPFSFPVALYHKQPLVKLTPSDFDGVGSAGGCRRQA